MSGTFGSIVRSPRYTIVSATTGTIDPEFDITIIVSSVNVTYNLPAPVDGRIITVKFGINFIPSPDPICRIDGNIDWVAANSIFLNLFQSRTFLGTTATWHPL